MKMLGAITLILSVFAVFYGFFIANSHSRSVNYLCQLSADGNIAALKRMVISRDFVNKFGTANADCCREGSNPSPSPALHFAVVCKRTAVTKYLIAHGADVNSRGDGGLTPLMWANDAQTVDVLVSSGASMEARDANGMTALMHAVAEHNIDVMNSIVKHGATIDAIDQSGRTALMMAVDGRLDDILAKPLISHGANPDKKDHEGNSARTIASQQNNRAVLADLDSLKM